MAARGAMWAVPSRRCSGGVAVVLGRPLVAPALRLLLMLVWRARLVVALLLPMLLALAAPTLQTVPVALAALLLLVLLAALALLAALVLLALLALVGLAALLAL